MKLENGKEKLNKTTWYIGQINTITIFNEEEN